MTLNCKGDLIALDTPKIMGVLNLTPDSFYDGGKFKDETAILAQVDKMLTDGATFIDLGGYSSRPGADPVDTDTELKRITPVIDAILKRYPQAVLSIDTFRSKVAKIGIAAGAAMINDIAAGQMDPEMLATVAALGVPYIMMHMRGTPKTMQQQTDYKDLIGDINYYFSERLAEAKTLGINDIVIDPGFGFAKTTAQNFHLLSHLALLNIADCPILAGLSRKSMIYKTLGTTPAGALNGTTALHMVALMNGALFSGYTM